MTSIASSHRGRRVSGQGDIVGTRTPKDYARLHWRWYEDPVLRAAGEQEPAVMTLWPVLVAMAKEASHVETAPTGAVMTTVRTLAQASMVKLVQIERSLSLLEEGDLVTVVRGKLGSLAVTLLAFSKWQVPRYSGAEREQLRRDREEAASRENSAPRDGGVTASCGSRDGDVTEREKEREKESRSRSTPLSSSSEPDRGGRTSPKQPAAIDSVYQHWLAATRKDPARTKLTKERRRKIQQRLADGYSPEQLCEAVDYWLADPHHRGENDRGTVYDDLVTLLRDETKVAKALEAAAAGPPAPARSGERRYLPLTDPLGPEYRALLRKVPRTVVDNSIPKGDDHAA